MEHLKKNLVLALCLGVAVYLVLALLNGFGDLRAALASPWALSSAYAISSVCNNHLHGSAVVGSMPRPVLRLKPSRRSTQLTVESLTRTPLICFRRRPLSSNENSGRS